MAVVDAQVPLLISNQNLEEWKSLIDFEACELRLKETDEVIKLQKTGSGHLTIPLSKHWDINKDVLIHDVFAVVREDKLNYPEVKKLRRIYGHPKNEKIWQVIKDAKLDNPQIKELSKKVSDNCGICWKFRKKESKPKVGLPKAREVNHVVSVDLKAVLSLLENPLDKSFICYLVDEFSRYTAGGVSPLKT